MYRGGWCTCIYERDSNEPVACVSHGSYPPDLILGHPDWPQCAPGEMYHPADSSCRPVPPAEPTLLRAAAFAGVFIAGVVVLALGIRAVGRLRTSQVVPYRALARAGPGVPSKVL